MEQFARANLAGERQRAEAKWLIRSAVVVFMMDVQTGAGTGVARGQFVGGAVHVDMLSFDTRQFS